MVSQSETVHVQWKSACEPYYEASCKMECKWPIPRPPSSTFINSLDQTSLLTSTLSAIRKVGGVICEWAAPFGILRRDRLGSLVGWVGSVLVFHGPVEESCRDAVNYKVFL